MINIYLMELLTNHNKYKSKINAIKNYPEYSSQQEINFYSKISHDLGRLNFCIEQLKDDSRNIIKQIYFDNLSLSHISKVMHLSKSAIFKKKQKALLELEEIFEI